MTRSAASVKTVPQTPDLEPVEEVSRLTLWTEMLEHESEEVVAQIVETLLSKVMDRCFQVDIKQQMIPYTTKWMKNCLVQSIEQHFLCRDEGDGPDDMLPEDSEPPRAETDTWAKGCVPLVTPSPPLRLTPPKEVEVVQQERNPEVLHKRSTIPQPKVSPKLPTKKTSPNLTVNKYCSSFPPPKTEKKNIQVPIRAKPRTFLPPLTNSTDKKTVMAEKTHENRSQTVDSKQSPQISLNKRKVIQKLDPASLPDHYVFPKYEIVDSNTKTQKIRANRPPQKPLKQEPKWTVTSQTAEVDIRPKYGTVTSSEPLRLETMVLSKGVTLSQSLNLNQPPPPPSPQTPSVKLRPIKTEPAPFKFPVNHYFVSDPQVKPLSHSHCVE